MEKLHVSNQRARRVCRTGHTKRIGQQMRMRQEMYARLTFGPSALRFSPLLR